MKMKVKNFNQFLEEVTIRGNEGVPNEYLDRAERRAKTELGLTGRENPMQVGMQIMPLVEESTAMIAGKERELEKLAEDVIRAEYGSILDGVELDIKFADPNEVAQFMQDEEEEEDQEQPTYRELNDPAIKKEIHKGKIVNNITQGEAKNTKNILHTDAVKDGINEIFGEVDGKRIFSIWDRISKLAAKMDWIIPINIKARMMEENPQGMAGASKADWKPKEVKAATEEDINKEVKEEDDKEEEYRDEFTPIVRARGIDFPMLLHETVKGIFELIGANAIPNDDRIANIVKMNTSSYEDEAEDFRYGPELAADLRDFTNVVIDEKSRTNRDINNYENLREFVWGKMVDRNFMTTPNFLILFKGILKNEQSAKTEISRIIDIVIEEIKKFNDEVDKDKYDFSAEADSDVLEPEGEEKDDDILIPKKDEEKVMSKRDIEMAIDTALDNDDFVEAKRLGDMLNKLYPEKK